MAVNICQYTKTCPVFQGTKEVTVASLDIYKNVFCKRGLKGWNNCEQYIECSKQTSLKEND